MRSLVALGLFLVVLDASAQLNSTSAAVKLRASVMPMDQRKRLAVPILEAAEKQAAALDDVDRALVLYRVAGGWMPLDRERSSALYREAFLASLHADGAFRAALEHMILDETIPLAPAVVMELVPRAEKETQQRIYRATLMYALMNSQTELAAQVFQAAADNQAVTGRMASTVLANLPIGARAQAFRTITAFYSQNPPSFGNWVFSGLISQFYASLPSQDVLKAIDIILQSATDYDSKHPGGQSSMSSGENNIFFHKEMDVQLFAVAPALQKLDPARAASLLHDSPDTTKWLAKYPQGLESFDQNHSFHGGSTVQPSAVSTDLLTFGSPNASERLSFLQTDEGLEFTRADYPGFVEPTGADFFEFFADRNSPEYAAYRSVVSASEPDVLAAVANVPVMVKVPTACSGPNGDWCSYAETYPQSKLVRSLADHWTYAGKEESSRAALQALPIVLEKIPAQQRCPAFTDAADLYLRMGDRASAYRAVETGFAAAVQATKQEDTAYTRPIAQLLRPSASCYHTLISAGVNAEYDSLYKAIDSLQSPALRAYATAALGRALLGVPMRRNLVVFANGSSSSQEAVGSYSAF